MDLTFDDLLSTGAHFGHLTRKCYPPIKFHYSMWLED